MRVYLILTGDFPHSLEIFKIKGEMHHSGGASDNNVGYPPLFKAVEEKRGIWSVGC